MTYLEAGLEVLNIIEMNGYEAFFVGGFVRDYILGIESNDIDITTNALPSQISNVFKVVNTGIKYNSVTIIYEGYSFETTTYRLESDYKDYRHPVYEVGRFLSDDLKRRDFTINAMAMDKDLNVIDLFGGQDDLKNKVIRTVFDPQKRFTEDALRILRAAYFSAKLGFSIETDTFNAMKKCSHLVQYLSNDRIVWELEKLVNSKHSYTGLAYLIECNVAPYLGELKKPIYLFNDKKTNYMTWVDFLAVAYYENIDNLMQLHLKSNVVNVIKDAIILAKRYPKNEYSRLDLFDNSLPVCLAANNLNVNLFDAIDKADYLRCEYALLPIHSLSDLAIKGHDIIENIEIKDNRQISVILKDIIRLVLMNKLDNSKECILQYIKEYY